MTNPKLDVKGIFSFLGITFFITYLIEGALILSGFRITNIPTMGGQLVVAAVMWVPALATVLTIKFVSHEGMGITNLRFGSWKPYLASGLILPVSFLLIYALTWLLGLGQPDWHLTQFQEMIATSVGPAAPMPSPGVILVVLFVVTLLVSPVINGILGFGEEFGWRGYLLPKLMPLGKVRAYVIEGIIWGLWHLPLLLIGFTYGHSVFGGILAFFALTTAFGIYLNELTLHYKSSVLAGWVHGVFNSQKLGIWLLLFPGVNPLAGGYAGAVGIFIWLILGLAAMWYVKNIAGNQAARS